MLFENARVTQIIFLSLFLCLEVSTRDWMIHSDLILVIVASCLATQWLLSSVVEYAKSDSEYDLTSIKSNILFCPEVSTSLRSASIASSGICLLL